MKYRYEECYAKILLENLFYDQYQNLVILDKPDLQDINKKVGIEVTDCTPRKKQELIANWQKAYFGDAEKKKKYIERMKQLGIEYTGGVQFWGSETYANDINCSPIKEFLNAVEKKVKKINAGKYALCGKYDLFVLSEIFIPTEQKAEVLNQLAQINNDSIAYENIYLSTNENTLIRFNMKLMQIDEKDFENKQREYAIIAKDMAKYGIQ